MTENTRSQPKVLITGPAGFIGRSLTTALSNCNRSLRLLVHRSQIEERDNIEIFPGDITDPSRLEAAMEGCGTVFHLAAALGSEIADRKDFQRVNVTGTGNLLQAARQAGIRHFIHFSSAGVLGKVKGLDIADENYPLNPISRYDRTKLKGEAAALESASENMQVTVIRPGWVYGPGDRRTFKLIRAIAAKRFILVTGAGTRQTPVHIDDLIRGTLAVETKGTSGSIYHLAGPEVLTIAQISDSIAEAAGTNIPRFPVPRLVLNSAAWCLDKLFRIAGREAPLTPGKLAFFTHPKPLDIEKAVEDLGYTPEIDFRTGIIRTIKWYRENGWLGKGGPSITES